MITEPVKRSDVAYGYDVKVKVYRDGTYKQRIYTAPIEKIREGYEKVAEKLDLDEKEKSKAKRQRLDNLARTRDTLADYVINEYDKWKSFITLTFADNVTDVKEANYEFNKWCSSVQRKMKDKGEKFSYIGVPEFQKRGAVHYHILTNLECGGVIIPERKEKKLYKPSTREHTILKYYDLKYWNQGFSSAFDIVQDTDSDFNVAKYIMKYLYKDLDIRLFNHKKILKSNDLRKPGTFELSTNQEIAYADFIEYVSQFEVQSVEEVKSCKKYCRDFTEIIYKCEEPSLMQIIGMEAFDYFNKRKGY